MGRMMILMPLKQFLTLVPTLYASFHIFIHSSLAARNKELGCARSFSIVWKAVGFCQRVRKSNSTTINCISTNITMESPEIILVGQKGSGKTMLLESILGYPITCKKDGACELSKLKFLILQDNPTNRPLIVSLMYNPECVTPRAFLRRDPFLPKFDSNIEVPLVVLPDALQERCFSHLVCTVNSIKEM